MSELEKAAEGRSLPRDCRLALRKDVARIKAWWEHEFDRAGTRGLAVFASTEEGMFETVPLSGQVADVWRIGESLFVLPLVDHFGNEGTLVAVVSRERGILYRFEEGRLREIVDETAEAPGQHEQGGWSQANYQRHIENIVEQHLKTVGGAIGRRLHGVPDVQMIVVAPEEMRSAFTAKLSTEARGAIVGWATAESHAGPSALMRALQPALYEARARRVQAALVRWRDQLRPGGRGAAGWQDTLEVAYEGRVELLLLEEGTQRTVWQCPGCGRAFTEGGTCPVDGLALAQQPDGSDVVLHHVLANGGTALRAGAGALTDADGIGALLRF
jgi:peptide chain release factor subunit 1